MHRELMNDLPSKGEPRSKALTWATSLFWIDILMTLAIVTAIASRL